MHKQAKKLNNWTNYRKFQKECKKAFRHAEQNFINQNILKGLENNNSKPFWKYVKRKKQDNIGVAPMKKDGSLINDCKGN